MSKLRKFWPLDYDQEDEIFENLSWNLPGRTRLPKVARRRTQRKRNSKPSGA